MSNKCGNVCEVYTRIVGYHRPVQNWNKGKKEEYKQRKTYSLNKSLESKNGKCQTLEVCNVSP
jgi:ribonucleoside-triphosphate reductase (formate)